MFRTEHCVHDWVNGKARTSFSFVLINQMHTIPVMLFRQLLRQLIITILISFRDQPVLLDSGSPVLQGADCVRIRRNRIRLYLL